MSSMAKRPKTFSEQIRRLILTSGYSAYKISKDTGIDKATLSRFLNGKSGLSMPNLDALAEYLGWEVKTKGGHQRRKGR
jgi:transcriptional regulator with XRE-family HTH domain